MAPSFRNQRRFCKMRPTRPLCFILLVAVSSASKDSNFYGFTNPNLGKKMFWADAGNVLQDITQFKALFIKFHRCVWSPYSGAYDGYDYDVDGARDSWYIGQTQRFRANAAYSLYGVLQSDETTVPDQSTSKMCKKSTYINSFFSEYGAPNFSNQLGISSDYATSYCSYHQVNFDNEEYDEENEESGSGDEGNDERLNFEDYESITMGCSNGKFVVDKFRGTTCQGRNYLDQVLSLDAYNEAMEGIDCIQVWNSYSDAVEEDAEAYEAGYEGRKLEDGDDGGDSSIAETILAKSSACSTRAYPKDCPDPYNLKKGYEAALERASSRNPISTYSRNKFTSHGVVIAAWVILSIGVIFIAAALFDSWQRSKSEKSQKRDKGELGKRKRKREQKHRSKAQSAYMSALPYSKQQRASKSKAKKAKNHGNELGRKKKARTLRLDERRENVIRQHLSDASVSVASVGSSLSRSVQESIRSYAESIQAGALKSMESIEVGALKNMEFLQSPSGNDYNNKEVFVNVDDYVTMASGATAPTEESLNSDEKIETVVNVDDYVSMSSPAAEFTSQQKGRRTMKDIPNGRGKSRRRKRGRLSRIVFGSRKGYI